jgi:subtilisin
LFLLEIVVELLVFHELLAPMREYGAVDHLGRGPMSVWIERGVLSLAVLGLLAAAPVQAQNGLSTAAGAAAVFDACPDPATDPVDVRTPCFAMVSFDSLVSKDERAVIVRGTGAAVRFNFSIVDAAAVLIPNEAAYWALADNPDITAFTPDRRVEAFGREKSCLPWPSCKNDGGDSNESGGGGGNTQTWPSGVTRIGAHDAHQAGYTGSGVGVAIADTGLDFNHADLDLDPDLDPCFDAFGGDCSDGNGHGTHVGGTVAAVNNLIDVVGVAPGATLYAVRVLNNSGSGSDSTVIAGLGWVAANAELIDVVNMSLGRPSSNDDSLLNNAIQAVVNVGVTVVVAAGNDPGSEISQMMPAGHPSVMAVASTTAEGGSNNKCRSYGGVIGADTASYFTTDGAGVAISAPGAQKENISRRCSAQTVGILSLRAGGGTTRMSGTSMASPHVAGVVALILDAACTALLPVQVRGFITAKADLAGAAPIDSPTNGYSFDGVLEGIVDADAAAGAAKIATCS